MEICLGCRKKNNEILRKTDNFIIFRCIYCNTIYSNIQDNKILNKEIGKPNNLKFYELPRFLINRYTFYVAALWDFSYLQRHIDLNKIKTCLDVGAQYGFLIRELTNNSINAIGVEVERYPYSVTSKIIYKFFDVNYDETEKFDLICLTNIIHYFSDNHAILKKCLRLLNENGILFITSLSPESTHIKEFIERREYGPLMYMSKKSYELFSKENNLTILDYSTFKSRLFLTKVSLKEKIKVGFRLILFAFKIYPSFIHATDGERNYILIQK